MSLAKVFSINASLCLFCGLVMALKSQTVNTLIGNPYQGIMVPAGILFTLYGGWLWWAAVQARANKVSIRALQLFVIGDYGWTLLMLALVSIEQVFTTPAGIRLAFITALITAVMGALQFRHYKIMTGKR